MKLQVNPESKADRAMLDEYLDELRGVYWVEWKLPNKGKSRDNENYYWKKIIRPLAESIGYSRNEEEFLHDWLLEQFSFKMVDGPDGEPWKKIIRSSHKDFDSKWQYTYYDQIRVWAKTQLDYHIPLPNEYFEDNIDPKFKG